MCKRLGTHHKRTSTHGDLYKRTCTIKMLATPGYHTWLGQALECAAESCTTSVGKHSYPQWSKALATGPQYGIYWFSRYCDSTMKGYVILPTYMTCVFHVLLVEAGATHAALSATAIQPQPVPITYVICGIKSCQTFIRKSSRCGLQRHYGFWFCIFNWRTGDSIT